MKRGKNEKGEWINNECVWWRGNVREIERGKFWIGVLMRENEKLRGKFV